MTSTRVAISSCPILASAPTDPMRMTIPAPAVRRGDERIVRTHLRCEVEAAQRRRRRAAAAATPSTAATPPPGTGVARIPKVSCDDPGCPDVLL